MEEWSPTSSKIPVRHFMIWSDFKFHQTVFHQLLFFISRCYVMAKITRFQLNLEKKRGLPILHRRHFDQLPHFEKTRRRWRQWRRLYDDENLDYIQSDDITQLSLTLTEQENYELRHGIPFEDSIYSKSAQDLRDDGVVGAFAMDPNYSNLFKGCYRSLDNLLDSTQNTKSFDRSMKINLKELSQIRKSKQKKRVREKTLNSIISDINKREREKNSEGSEKVPDDFNLLDLSFKSKPSSRKTSSLDTFLIHLDFLSQHNRLGLLLEAYWPKIFRRLRFESKSLQDRTFSLIQDKLYRFVSQFAKGVKNPRFGIDQSTTPPTTLDQLDTGPPSPPAAPPPPPPKIILYLGNGTYKNTSRSVGLSGKRIFYELRKRGELIRWVIEFRTSKMCSVCGQELHNAGVHKHKADPNAKRNQSEKQRNRNEVFKESRLNSVKAPESKTTGVYKLRKELHRDEPCSNFPLPRRQNRTIPPDFKRKKYDSMGTSTTSPKHPRIDHMSCSSESSMSTLSNVKTTDHDDFPAHFSLFPSSSSSSSSSFPAATSTPLSYTWGVRKCISLTCKGRYWDRDVNAARNMLNRVSYALLARQANPSKLVPRDGPDYLSIDIHGGIHQRI